MICGKCSPEAMWTVRDLRCGMRDSRCLMREVTSALTGISYFVSCILHQTKKETGDPKGSPASLIS